jgi:hypothetical protein
MDIPNIFQTKFPNYTLLKQVKHKFRIQSKTTNQQLDLILKKGTLSTKTFPIFQEKGIAVMIYDQGHIMLPVGNKKKRFNYRIQEITDDILEELCSNTHLDDETLDYIGNGITKLLNKMKHASLSHGYLLFENIVYTKQPNG